MSSPDVEDVLAGADPGDYVDLSFEDRREFWHVNDRITVGLSDAEQESVLEQLLGDEMPENVSTTGLVLQRADASHEWLVVALQRYDDDYEFGDVVLAEGTVESREPVDADSIEVHGVASKLRLLKTNSDALDMEDEDDE